MSAAPDPPTSACLSAVIFDLDGTLADTLPDIASAMNHALQLAGLPRHDHAAYRRFVGEGVTRLVAQAAPDADPDTRSQLVASFRSHYGAHMLDRSAPYPGIPELLEALRARGVPLAVLSNKPHDATCQMVRAMFPHTPFVAVLGQRDAVPRKPDPAGVLETLPALGVPAAACALVGDTRIDMETARAAGVVPIGVTWGFRAPPELREAGAVALLQRPADLLSWVAE